VADGRFYAEEGIHGCRSLAAEDSPEDRVPEAEGVLEADRRRGDPDIRDLEVAPAADRVGIPGADPEADLRSSLRREDQEEGAREEGGSLPADTDNRRRRRCRGTLGRDSATCLVTVS
jgi:hypothetical protein